MSTLSLFDRAPSSEQENEHDEPRVFRVGEVNRTVRLSLEEQWPDVWIEGELADTSKAASGHVYFTLADEEEQAQLRGVMFRGDARRARARLEKGNRVRMRGQLSLYEPRGSFQLIARVALPSGDGDLAAQFERVRRKLHAEGLLDPERKRPVPRLPRVVGVVTSASGAAMHDIVRVARGRCPVRLVVADCRVQGQDAPESIVRGLDAIQKLPHLDAVLVARGGGSSEELWSFNDERVARAIANCRVPTISGVGHEVDITIADLVADVRASTPSNAAELAVPDKQSLEAELEGWQRRLQQAHETRIGREKLRLERLSRRLGDPRHALGRIHRQLDAHAKTMVRLTRRRLVEERDRLKALDQRLATRDPRTVLARGRRTLMQGNGKLAAAARRTLEARWRALADVTTRLRSQARPLVERRRARHAELVARLEAMSPLKVLARGYAIALHEPSGRALMRATDAQPGDRLRVRVHEGTVHARIEDTDPGEQERS